MKPLRVVSALLVAVGVAVAVVPHFTSCPAPMGPCIETARWETYVGAGIALIALGAFFSRQPGLTRALAAGAAALSALAIALPTEITGTCKVPTMHCVLLMKPSIIALGTVGILLALTAVGQTILRANSRIPDPLGSVA